MAQLEVTCKTGDGEYKKHYLGISDNVTYFVEQLDPDYALDYASCQGVAEAIISDWMNK